VIVDHTFRPYDNGRLDGEKLCAWLGSCHRRPEEHAPRPAVADHLFRPYVNNPERGNRQRCAFNGCCDRAPHEHTMRRRQDA
jgi:hypothetical protein